ncbi:hypothetical protein EAS64_33780 [Trebonia kvetii]|uniref:Uncharacterized protein n=1 Tax=Trebonia kvetii TaxID=2480626 RepID=A0A6P2BQE0_9ACTN|nr:hypothetical protein [Trebonia kvetii]TVZ01252.1 hypothetical protein EAS64_33780 [Trebonia kvetii]
MKERTATVKLSIPDDLCGADVELMIEQALEYVKDAGAIRFMYPDMSHLDDCEVIEIACDDYAT